MLSKYFSAIFVTVASYEKICNISFFLVVFCQKATAAEFFCHSQCKACCSCSLYSICKIHFHSFYYQLLLPSTRLMKRRPVGTYHQNCMDWKVPNDTSSTIGTIQFIQFSHMPHKAFEVSNYLTRGTLYYVVLFINSMAKTVESQNSTSRH